MNAGISDVYNESRHDDVGICSVIVNSNSFTDESCERIPTVVNFDYMFCAISTMSTVEQ
jgi:hypothetical protein